MSLRLHTAGNVSWRKKLRAMGMSATGTSHQHCWSVAIATVTSQSRQVPLASDTSVLVKEVWLALCQHCSQSSLIWGWEAVSTDTQLCLHCTDWVSRRLFAAAKRREDNVPETIRVMKQLWPDKVQVDPEIFWRYGYSMPGDEHKYM